MTLTEDMTVEARRLVNLLEDPHPGLATWQQAVNEVMSKLADLYFKPEDGAQAQPKPTTKEPNFFSKLRKHHVEIGCTDGAKIRGILLKYSRYEVLIQEDSALKDKPPKVVMKHAIRCIDPLDGNPFAKPGETEDQMKEGVSAPAV